MKSGLLSFSRSVLVEGAAPWPASPFSSHLRCVVNFPNASFSLEGVLALVSPCLPDSSSGESSSISRCQWRLSCAPAPLPCKFLSPTKKRNKISLARCVSGEPTASCAKSSEAICLITSAWIYARVDVICPGIESLKFTNLPLLKIWTTFVNLQPSGTTPAFYSSSRIAYPGSVTTSACSFSTLGSDVQRRKPPLIHCSHFPCLFSSIFGNKPLLLISSLYVVFWLEK